MGEHIGQRELRNESGAVMRRVEQGESFTITRNGRPVADLVPHARTEVSATRSLGEVQDAFRALPEVDAARWRRERAEGDALLGDDDPGDADPGDADR